MVASCLYAKSQVKLIKKNNRFENFYELLKIPKLIYKKYKYKLINDPKRNDC